MLPSSDALLARMADLHPIKIDLSLDRTYRLLEKLGNPHLRVPPVIHIAGTNGKGSTLAMIRAGLAAAGLRVHAYTSPHLVRFHERIELSGREITEAALADVLARTLEANAGGAVTYFEATTCAAFLAFAETPADMLLLEVGMGGRLDTTNVIDRPELTIITPVDLDHQAFLGETRGEIAGEKAGILKRGVPCVVARQEEDATSVIEARASALGAPLVAHGQHWHVWEERGRTVFQDETGLLDLPLPALPGAHQIENAGTALAALRRLGRSEAICEAALTQARWPGRMQRLHGGLAELLPGGEVWLDSGHNAHAARAVAEMLARGPRSRPVHMIFGLQGGRNPANLLAAFPGLVGSVTAVPVPGEPSSHATDATRDAALSLGIPATEAASVAGALARIAEDAPSAKVVIFGSLYLAGAVLREHEALPQAEARRA